LKYFFAFPKFDLSFGSSTFSTDGAYGMMKETKQAGFFPERGEGCAAGIPIDF
jgi:hypothetical protein